MQFFFPLLWKNEALLDSHQVPSSAKWDGALLAKTKLQRPRWALYVGRRDAYACNTFFLVVFKTLTKYFWFVKGIFASYFATKNKD